MLLYQRNYSGLFRCKIKIIYFQLISFSAIWKPDTYFINSHSGYLHTTPNFNHLVRILANGRILYSSRYVDLI